MDHYGNLLMDECPPDLQSPGDEDKDLPKKPPLHSKGVATSFGFKRRPTTAPSIASNSNAARRLANADIIDRNGNGHSDTEPLTANIAPTARSTPRLMPPKKEGIATRVNRFGFRQPQANRLHKVSDLNNAPIELCNNNVARVKSNSANQKGKGVVGVVVDSNKNRMTKNGISPPQAEKFMLQSTQLPRPEPIRVIETKTAKTLANNNRRIAYHEDNSSKEGSLTEDSGVGSQFSAETMPGVERLNSSPTYGARRSFHKTRNLEIVKSGNTFDVRDLDDSSESCAPLPQLPSAFSTADNSRGNFYTSGFVREKAREYQRHLDDNRRKISVTSSEGFSDDYADEEKTFKDKFRSEKTFIKSSAHKFLKSKPAVKDDSSPPSSDEHEWAHGGEAMADEVSFSISSSDESKEKDQPPVNTVPDIAATIQNLMNASLNSPKDIKSMLLTIEDPKFAAVAAASNSSLMLDDETSPVDSLISYSESEEILKKKLNRSSSNSKDINEKLTPPSPGTPTNISNSLSLSDGKDDFLIDDEIADQPALVFEDTLVATNDGFSISQNNSESTNTMVDSTPKPKRRTFLGVDGSPISSRKKKSLHSRTGSLDTLSPCESIASDDLMMDYDYSQSSGVEDDKNDNHNHGFLSLDDTLIRKAELDDSGGLRDWASLLGNYTSEKNSKSNASKTTRLLWSRTGTPNSVPDSPKSVDSKSTARSRHSVTSSPLRLSKGVPLSAGYDSDDSIRLDRASHSAMKQDIMSIKTMLLKLRRVLNEQPDEDILLRSETHIPFDGQLALTNGLFNGLCSSGDDAQSDEANDNRLELAELRRQVLFLQGQLEDKEKTVLELQEQMVKLTTDNFTSNSAPASTVAAEYATCNAATQTERIRPISAGPSLLNGSPTDGSSVGSLVSANESPQQRRSRPLLQTDCQAKKPSSKLWRKPGEPPSPQRYTGHSSIPRRANSRTRTPSLPS
ncbi:serine-rich adhesin for platelets isoform X3 [Zophobas morio]|uniref:serine-rich adhesin for platelets isoform X3 n=1 Tax=Zophobas morio TaxID=2755281 RepID=UPI003082F940